MGLILKRWNVSERGSKCRCNEAVFEKCVSIQTVPGGREGGEEGGVVLYLSIGINVDDVSLVYEHIEECSLSMVQMSDDRNVPDHLWVRSQSHHEPTKNTFKISFLALFPLEPERESIERGLLIIPTFLYSFRFSNPKLSRLDGFDDRYRERLGIFLLYHSFYSFSVHCRGRRVVRLVIVEDYCV